MMPRISNPRSVTLWGYCDGRGLPTVFLRIGGGLRNRCAHISAMLQAQYQQLHDLILSPEEDVSESVLGKILRMKMNILKYGGEVD